MNSESLKMTHLFRNTYQNNVSSTRDTGTIRCLMITNTTANENFTRKLSLMRLIITHLKSLFTVPMSVPVISDIYSYLTDTLSNSTRKVRPIANLIVTQFGFYFTIYLIICYIIYIISTVFKNHLSRSVYFGCFAKRVLVVTAHPDDECMFFGPVIVQLVKNEKDVYILCLSNGNYYKKGHLRKQELYDSCKVLGIPKENIFLCCSVLRLDGPDNMWKSEMIASLVNDYVGIFDIDTVITFDKKGVSGHQNHISLFRAMSYLSLRNWLPPNCRIFLLDSLGLFRSYSSVMDCLWSLLTSEIVFVLSPYEHERVKKAMYEHKTQIIWYRRIYLCLSRYTYINTFYELQRFQGGS